MKKILFLIVLVFSLLCFTGNSLAFSPCGDGSGGLSETCCDVYVNECIGYWTIRCYGGVWDEIAQVYTGRTCTQECSGWYSTCQRYSSCPSQCSSTSPTARPAPVAPAPTVAPTIAPTSAPTGGGGGGGGGSPAPVGGVTDPGGGTPPPAGPVCGDGICNGFESCASCWWDCGTCTAPTTAWWQTLGSHAFAGITNGIALKSSVPDSATCSGTCSPYITALGSTEPSSYGYTITGYGLISVNSTVKLNPGQIASIGTAPTRYRETYSFFYRKSNLGATPTDDFAGSATDARKPDVTKAAYFHDGDLTIQNQWDVAAGQSYIVFVDGNLTLSDPTNVEELIKVSEGGFVAFIVSGNITISNNVGNDTLTDTKGNVEGIYIADGTLTVASKGTAAGGDERFVGEGTFVGWTTIKLDRDYSDGGARATENNTKPTEQFVFRPDLVKNVPTSMKHPHTLWQETK